LRGSPISHILSAPKQNELRIILNNHRRGTHALGLRSSH
jgi:hypothetical protein